MSDRHEDLPSLSIARGLVRGVAWEACPNARSTSDNRIVKGTAVARLVLGVDDEAVDRDALQSQSRKERLEQYRKAALPK
jgi:hypothetical protein